MIHIVRIIYWVTVLILLVVLFVGAIFCIVFNSSADVAATFAALLIAFGIVAATCGLIKAVKAYKVCLRQRRVKTIGKN